MVSLTVFIIGVVSGVSGVTIGYGFLFAWVIIRGERNERRRERDYQKAIRDQREDLEREFEFKIREVKAELETVRGENAQLQARVNSLTDVLVKVQRYIGINIQAGDDVSIGEFVGGDKSNQQATNINSR